MMIGTALGWGNVATIVLAVALAFLFGYWLTMLPLLSSGMALAVLPLASACDAPPITVMEIVDNLIMLVVPGAMGADLASPLLFGPSRSPSPPPSRQPLPHSPRKGPRRCDQHHLHSAGNRRPGPCGGMDGSVCVSAAQARRRRSRYRTRAHRVF
jgi:uncharacterized protein DUF4396